MVNKLDALEISKLYRLLKDFSNTPCTTKCQGKYDVCPMYKRGICELLYYVFILSMNSSSVISSDIVFPSLNLQSIML